MQSAWDLLQQVFTVETVMTPWDEVATRPDSADRADIRDFAERERFDLIPIIRDGEVVSLYRWKDSSEETLADRWLVPHDASLPDLLARFEQNGGLSLLVSGLQGIVGIVTPADLNKMPARVFFFNAIAELEVALAEGIRKHYLGKHDEFINFITSEDRRAKLVETRDQMIDDDVEVDLVQFLMLSDLVNIVCHTDSLRTKLGFRSKHQVDKQLNGLVHFRNDVTHSVRPVLRNRDELHVLAEHVKRSRQVLAQIADALHKDRSNQRMRR